MDENSESALTDLTLIKASRRQAFARMREIEGLSPALRRDKMQEILAQLPSPKTPEERLEWANHDLATARSDEQRYYALPDVAKQSFILGLIDDARRHAEELLALSKHQPVCHNNWNTGNAIHDANMVLGRIALKEERIEDAKKHLLDAGATPGSPQLNSFGPNMSLAKDMIEQGEKEIVLAYFELCRKFWVLHRDRLDEWSEDIKVGRMPNFRANLVY